MIYIKSLLPNPAGRDAGQEWIRLSNNGDSPINTFGWRIEDSGGNSFSLSSLGEISSGETVELSHSLTEINLNNNGDRITLYNSEGTLISQLGYTETVNEGEIVFSESLELNPNTAQAFDSIVEPGLLRSYSSNGLWEPVLLGLLIAGIVMILFLYLFKGAFNEDE